MKEDSWHSCSINLKRRILYELKSFHLLENKVLFFYFVNFELILVNLLYVSFCFCFEILVTCNKLGYVILKLFVKWFTDSSLFKGQNFILCNLEKNNQKSDVTRRQQVYVLRNLRKNSFLLFLVIMLIV